MKIDLKDYFDFSLGLRRFLYSEILVGLSIGLFSLVLNLHMLAVGLNEEEIGKVLSLSAIVMCVFSLPFLMFTSYFDRKRLFVFGLALMTIGYFIFGFGTQLWEFYLAQCVLSCGNTIMFTYEMPLLYDYCRTPKEQVKAFNLLYAMFTFFVGLGTLIGGYLPQYVGGMTSSYQGTLLIAGGILLLLTLVRGIYLPHVPKHINEDSKTGENKTINKKQRIKVFVILVFFVLLTCFSAGWVTSFLNVIFKVKLSWDDKWVSSIIAFSGLFLFAGSLLIPVLFAKVNATKSYLLVFGLSILVNGFLFFALPNFLFVSLLMFRGGLTLMVSNMADSQSLAIVSNGDRNLFSAVRTIARNLGLAGSVFLTGVFLARKDYSSPFLYSVGTLIICLGYFLIFVRPLLIEHAKEE